MALDDHFDASRLAGHIDRSARLPVAGFWVRLIAFVVDIIVLRFAFYGIALGAREALLDLGEGARILSAALIFAYFWLGDGPIGGGKTVGKLLMGLRSVAAADGHPLSLAKAALRSMILLPPIFWSTAFLYSPGGNPPDSPYWLFFLITLPEALTLALILGQVVHVAFNPSRQGFHDGAAHSLVLGVDHSGTTWQVLEEQAGATGMLRMRRARQSGWICMAAVFLFFGYSRVREIQELDRVGYFECRAKLNAELRRHGVGMDLWPRPQSVEGKRTGKETQGEAVGERAGDSASPPKTAAQTTATTTTADQPTSPTALRPPREFECHLIFTGRVRRPPEQIRAEVEYLAGRIQEYCRDRSKIDQQRAAAKGITEFRDFVPREGSRVVLVYDEYLNLMLYQNVYEVLRVERTF